MIKRPFPVYGQICLFFLLLSLKALDFHFRFFFCTALNILYDKPSLELCRCLIMLKDSTITGKISVKESLPSLLNMLHFWRTIFTQHQSNSHHKVSSYHYRMILWKAGISISNKVLECLIIRYTNNCALLNLESYLLSLVKLHLAHGKCFD